jgi:hypothetical protein
MKLHRPLSRCIAISMVLTVSACATHGPGAPDAPDAPDAPGANAAPASEPVASAPSYPERRQPASAEPQPTATPGGYWPPKPIDAAATPAEAPRVMLTTDGMKLDAKRDPKAELKQRVIERWALLIGRRGEDAFGYLTPGHQKTHDKVKYGSEMAGRPVRWFRATFDKAECASEDSCEVSVLVDFRIRMSAGMGVTESFAYVKERWIAVDGVWYHLPTEAGG